MLKKIASNTLSQILSKAITAIISIFLIGILTKYLSTTLYWEYNKLYNYLSIFAFMADLWLYTITIREISKNKEKSEYIIWNALSLRFILWILIVFLALLISIFLPWYNNKLTFLWVLIVAIYTFFSLLNSSVLSLMQSYMKIEFSLFSVVFWKIINVLLIALVALIIFPIEKVINFEIPFLLILIAWVIWIVVNFFLNFYYANKIIKIRLLFDYEYMKYLFFTSLPYWVALFLSVVYFKVDIVLLSLFEPKNISNTSIALYSLPMKIVEVLMVLWTFYLNSILPLLSEYFKEEKLEEIKKILTNSFRFLFSFGLFVLVLWLLFKDYIIKIIATPDYLSHEIHTYTSSDVFGVVLFILVFYFISAIFNYIFIASKHEKKVLYINIVITIFNIIGNIILIPKFSFMWSWYVTLASQILLFLLLFYFSRSIVKFKFDIFYIIKVVLFSLIFYFSWNFILSSYSIGTYFDFFIYWSIFMWIYILFLLFLNKEFLKKRIN
jgi:O-antigen/teichoic acid export membrane protein